MPYPRFVSGASPIIHSEGFAVIANFRSKGVRRIRRVLIAASFIVPVVLVAIFVVAGEIWAKLHVSKIALDFLFLIYIISSIY